MNNDSINVVESFLLLFLSLKSASWLTSSPIACVYTNFVDVRRYLQDFVRLSIAGVSQQLMVFAV